MSKKTIALCLSLILALTLGLGGTLAYLTDTDAKVNTFTVGDVEIEIDEKYDDGQTLAPGIEVEKEVKIKNISETNDAWVWYTVAIPLSAQGGEELIAPTYNQDENWKLMAAPTAMEIDGSWYNVYTYLWDEIVPVDGETALGLQTIKMNPKVDYDPVSDSYKLVVGGKVTDVDYDLVNGKVYVNAFAIQTDGFTSVNAAYNAFVGQWGNLNEDMINAGSVEIPVRTLWNDNADTSWYDDAATTFELSSAEELAGLSVLVNEEGKSFAGKTVTLAADVDLDGNLWTPVGQTGATEFKGVFDGQNHTISNLLIDSSAETGGHYSSGLFGWIESNGQDITVKNLVIDGAEVTGHHNVAVVAGYLEGDSLVENVTVKNAVVTCTLANADANGDKVGGIAGYAAGEVRIKNCTVSDSAIDAGRDAGQVVGAAKTQVVVDCSASNVTVTDNGTGTGANIREELIGRVL